MAKTGPKGPRTPFDFKGFQALCSIHATIREVCNVLGISQKKLHRDIKAHYGRNATFSQVYEKFKDHGKVSLRRLMWKSARSGHFPAIKHLSDNLLGTSDKLSARIEGDVTLHTDFDIKKVYSDPRLVDLAQQWNDVIFENEEKKNT